MAQRHELDLTVGDVFRIGTMTITVIDIDEGDVTLRIDDPESQIEDHLDCEDHFDCIAVNCNSPLPR